MRSWASTRTAACSAFAARGIFGQGLFIDPKRSLVIASNADWGGGASERTASDAREAFYRAVQKAVDDEAAAAGAAAAAPAGAASAAGAAGAASGPGSR